MEKCEINYLEPAQNSGGASPDDNDLEIVFVSTRSDLIRRKHREFRARRRERHWPFGRQDRGAARLFGQGVPRQIPGWRGPQLFGHKGL